MENNNLNNSVITVRKKAKTRRGLASLNLNTDCLNLETAPPENIFTDEIKDILDAKKQCEINVQNEFEMILHGKMEPSPNLSNDGTTVEQEQPRITDKIDDFELLVGPVPKNPLSSEIHYLLEDLEKSKALYSTDKMEVDLEIDFVQESTESDFSFQRESIPVRVFCCNKYYRFTLAMNEHFLNVIEEIGQKLNVPSSRILLSLNDRVVKVTDTPSSIKLDIADIIDGYITDDSAPSSFTCPNAGADLANKLLNLKIQTKDAKSKVCVQIRKTDRMLILMEKFAEITSFEIENLRFTFDGEEIQPNDTPENLGIEDDFCIDVGIKS